MIDRSHSEHYLPDSHFHYLYEEKEPLPSNRIWLTSVVFPPERGELQAAFVKRNALRIEGDQGTNLDGYRIAFSVAFLAFQVFGYDGDEELDAKRTLNVNGTELEQRDFLPQLWPLTGEPFIGPRKPRLT